MIRRDDGQTFILISQHDHAVLAGQVMACVGGRVFAVPTRHPVLTLATSLHDCGWPTHDDAPTLNDQGLPRDVFESTPSIGLSVWQASAERATGHDPYAGLLVSLHSLSLSILAASSGPSDGREDFDLTDPHVKFAVNKFQHREIERQEDLRKAIGLRTDLPLLHGLADPGQDGREDLLAYHLRLLQAMDLISLGLCCTKPPSARTRDVQPRVGAKALQLKLTRTNATTLHVSPWPFESPRLNFSVPMKRVPNQSYESQEAFGEVYARSPIEMMDVTVAS